MSLDHLLEIMSASRYCCSDCAWRVHRKIVKTEGLSAMRRTWGTADGGSQ